MIVYLLIGFKGNICKFIINPIEKVAHSFQLFGPACEYQIVINKQINLNITDRIKK